MIRTRISVPVSIDPALEHWILTAIHHFQNVPKIGTQQALGWAAEAYRICSAGANFPMSEVVLEIVAALEEVAIVVVS
jgi:hypothetical protein